LNLHAAILAVDELMDRVVSTDVTVLQEASRHILLAGGKRIRPRLAFLSYQAVGGGDLKRMVPLAAALEIMHTATLVHDDINDHGTMRRNRPTINAIWGRTLALLTGDYLFTKVYELMAPYGKLNAVLAEATVKLVEGETLQTQAAKTGSLDQDMYYRIISCKTAALFAAAAKIGAMLGEGTEAQTGALADYAFNVGLAFQITDDILDLMADSEQLGKTAGLDLAQGKGIATAVQGDGDNADAAAVDVGELDPLPAFKQIILQGDAVEQARAMARSLTAKAVESLGALPPSPPVDELGALAWRMVERDR
jgi:octaprenyl-diphosphate synthase